MLRLLALWVSNTYQAGYKGAYRDPIISLGTAPLEDPMFRAAVFEQLGETKLEVPVTTDICGRKESHAVRLDAEAVDTIKKARLHRKVATTIFFESNGGQFRQGTTVPEIRLNVAEPELDIGNVETVLETMNQTLYYLHADRNRYRFSLTPALNKLLADRLATVNTAKIKERIHTEIGKVFPTGVVERILFAKQSSDVPDRSRLTLVVLSPEYPLQEPETLRLVEKITKEYGTSARTYKSGLIWAIADTAASLRDDARKLLAWEDIQDEIETGSHNLDETQTKQLRESLIKARQDLGETVWRSYKNVALLDRSNEIRVIDLGLVHSSSTTGTPVNLIINRLRQDGEIEDAISPNFLMRNWPPAFKEWSTRSVRDAFFASPQFPKLLNADAIKDTIAKGVENGILGYVGKVQDKYEPFHFATDLLAYDVEISDDMFIVTQEVAQKYKAAQAAQTATPVVGDTPVTGQINDGAGVYTTGTTQPGSSTSTPEPDDSSLPEPSKTTRLTWAGQVPAQKWTNFYMKVLTKFASNQEQTLTLKVEINVEASGDAGLSAQKIEETKIALRELGLDDNVTMG